MKERKRRLRIYRAEKVTKRPAEIRTGDLSLTGRMLFRLSPKSRSIVKGVRIRLSQSTPSRSLKSHLLPYTIHAWLGFFFFLKERKTRVRNYRAEKGTKTPGDLSLTFMFDDWSQVFNPAADIDDIWSKWKEQFFKEVETFIPYGRKPASNL